MRQKFFSDMDTGWDDLISDVYNKNIVTLEPELMGGNIYRQHFKLAKEDPNKPLSELKIEEKPFLNWDMTFNMIEEGIEVINGFDNNNITQNSIDTLKEFIKSKTLNIK